MVVESQHTHARMVHGSRCMRDASCVLKRAKTSSHDITIDPRYSFDLTIKFLHGSGAGDLEQRCLQWRVPLSHREKEKLAKFRGGTQSFRQWMLSIERQIGSEDPRLWMLIHRTIDFTMPIVQQVIEDYVTNMRDDTVYWSQSDGTAKGEFAYRYTELSTLVMKLHYRLLDALEDEVLTYVETQQVARNGCEVLRLLKSRYALETQYIETDLITKVHTWTFDKNDLERSIIDWERLIHRLSTQHNFKFEPRQLFATLIRGLPEDLRLTMNRDGVVDSWLFEDESLSIVETSDFPIRFIQTKSIQP